MSGGFMKTDISGKAEVVLTTKGDLATWDTARVRKGVSATNYTGLQADSSIADGLTYGATARSTLTADQDLLVASGANTLSRLAKGSDNQTLMMNGTSINWETVSSGGASTALDNLSSVAVNATIDMNTQNLINTQYFGCKAYLEKTISSNNITFTQTLTEIDTESDASTDDLDGFLGLTNGFWLSLKSVDNARDPTLRSGVTGENKMNGVGSYTLADKDYRWIGNCYIGGYFNIQELSRSSNTA